MHPEAPLLGRLYLVRRDRRLAERPDHPVLYVMKHDSCEPREKATASRDLTQPPQCERHAAEAHRRDQICGL